jgi:hypothetical protein
MLQDQYRSSERKPAPEPLGPVHNNLCRVPRTTLRAIGPCLDLVCTTISKQPSRDTPFMIHSNTNGVPDVGYTLADLSTEVNASRRHGTNSPR